MCRAQILSPLTGVKVSFEVGLKSTHTVIRFVQDSAKFGTCTFVRLNGTLVEDKMLRFKSKCAHFSFNKCHG
jgi:hypothetical protein